MKRLFTSTLVFAFCAVAGFAAGSPASDGLRIPADSVATKKTPDVKEEADPPLLIADRMPSFEGGDISMFDQWLLKKIKYPTEAIERDIEGDVTISFVIEKDGTLSTTKELSSPDPLLTKEVIRRMTEAPKWKPGSVKRTPVRVKQTITFKFELTDELRDKLQYMHYSMDHVHTPPKMEGVEFADFPAWVAQNIEYESASDALEDIGRVKITVNKDGTTEYMTWGDSSPKANELLEQLFEGRNEWTPATRFGKPVQFVDDIEVRFGPDSKVTASIVDPAEVAATGVYPKFQGGDLKTFRTWIAKQIKYPKEAAKRQISGTVMISFVIEKDGLLSSIEILDSPHMLLTMEAIRVVSSSPLWEPGTERGKPVRVKFNLPVQFLIQ